LRENEVYLDALDVERVPAPSTAGDFLRRFDEATILRLQQALNQVRAGLWQRQGAAFRKLAVIDVDGTFTETEAQCKEGIAYSGHKRAWGYAPLLVSLAQTGEPLFVVNRPGSAVSQLGAAPWMDRALDLVEPVFDRVYFRGDTDFSLTEHFDKWHARGAQFIFGYDATRPLVGRAEALPEATWSTLQRLPSYRLKTTPRRKAKKLKQEIVYERAYKKITLVKEEVASFAYRPGKCARPYRMVVLRKHERITRAAQVLEERHRYLFYITNDEQQTSAQLVLFIDQRCNQENLIEQLKNGVPAFHAPSNTLAANWVAMVIAALARESESLVRALDPGAAPAARHRRYGVQAVSSSLYLYCVSDRAPGSSVDLSDRGFYVGYADVPSALCAVAVPGLSLACRGRRAPKQDGSRHGARQGCGRKRVGMGVPAMGGLCLAGSGSQRR